MKRVIAVALFAAVGAGFAAIAQTPAELRYYSPGSLVGSGERGVANRKVYFSRIDFPVAFDSATQRVVLNSQVYNPGGYLGGSGDHCSAGNYAMPWRDTFCERGGRGNRNNPMCTHDTNASHQGVDIRPPTCETRRWDAIAVDDGVIELTYDHVLKLSTDSGVTFIYRHLDPASISHWRVNDRVTRGQALGRIAHFQGFDRNGVRIYTTRHLHLEAFQADANGRAVPWPLYASLVSAYRRELGLGDAIGSDGMLTVDPAREVSMP